MKKLYFSGSKICAMLYRAFACYLGLTLILGSCTSIPHQSLIEAGAPKRVSEQDTIPFELRAGYIVVRARLNDKSMPLDFIWDSGAPVSRLSRATLSYLGRLELADAPVFQLDSVQLGRTVFQQPAFQSIGYEGYAAPKCIAEAGILGANFIQHCNWRIDFDQQHLILKPKSQPLGPGGAAYTLDFKSTPYGQPRLKWQVEGLGKADVVAAIGHEDGLHLQTRKIPANARRAYDKGIRHRFAAGVDTFFLIEGHTAKAGPLKWQGTLSVRPDQTASWVGNDLWAQYNIGLDYAANAIYLTPRSQPAPSATPLPALGWMPHFTPMSELSVGFLIEGSPAWEAGLRMGDTIEQIDRRAAPGWYNDFCTYLSEVETQFGQPSQMMVKRKGNAPPLQLRVNPQ